MLTNKILKWYSIKVWTRRRVGQKGLKLCWRHLWRPQTSKTRIKKFGSSPFFVTLHDNDLALLHFLMSVFYLIFSVIVKAFLFIHHSIEYIYKKIFGKILPRIHTNIYESDNFKSIEYTALWAKNGNSITQYKMWWVGSFSRFIFLGPKLVMICFLIFFWSFCLFFWCKNWRFFPPFFAKIEDFAQAMHIGLSTLLFEPVIGCSSIPSTKLSFVTNFDTSPMIDNGGFLIKCNFAVGK